MEMVAEVTLNPLRAFRAILGSFWGHFGTIFNPEIKFVADQSCDHSKRLQEEQNADENGFEIQLQDVQVILGPKMAPNDPKMTWKLQKSAGNGFNVFKVTSEIISIRILLLLRSCWVVT